MSTTFTAREISLSVYTYIGWLSKTLSRPLIFFHITRMVVYYMIITTVPEGRTYNGEGGGY